MLKKLSKKSTFAVALIIIFSVISAFCLIMQIDDFLWYYVYDIEELFPYQNPNGRYFTNQLTYLTIKFPLIRYIVFSVVLSSLIIIISHLVDFDRKSDILKYCLVFSLFVLIPHKMFANVINWISGFTNYVISMLFTLIYIFYCFKIIFDKNYTPSKIWLIFAPVLGLLGALCVENITVYNILFGIFAIIIIYKFRKRFFVSNILYFLMSVTGFVFMLGADNYNELFNKEKDSLGIRHIEFVFSDIFMQIYRRIIPNYSKQFFVINILLAVCFVYLYYKADNNNWNTSVKRYSKMCINIIVLYSGYSLFVNCFSDLEIFDLNMKIRALETAFTFVYLISLVYLSFVLLEPDKFLRFTFYIVSTVIVVAPFAVVNPITPRCFFADGIFWILASGEIFFACYEKSEIFRNNEVKRFFCLFSIFMGVFICNINISNKLCDNIRIDYIKKQINEDNKFIEIINFPYGNYIYDDLEKDNIFDGHLTDNIDYVDLLFKYYNIDADKDNFNYIYIDIVDYNTK